MGAAVQNSTIRLAEILGALSLATDLSVGCPMETALRTALIAARLGEAYGCSRGVQSDAYYAALLRLLGCTGASHEEAFRFGAGDDIALRQAFVQTDLGDPAAVLQTAVTELARGAGIWTRTRAVARFVGPQHGGAELTTIHCVQAMALARDLGMGPGVLSSLAQMYERFDGRGLPGAFRGEGLMLSARLMHIAYVVELQRRAAGREAARSEVQKRAGGQLDPELVALFLKREAEVLQGLDAGSVWEEFLHAEPAPQRRVDAGDLESFARAFACFVDLKSPYTLGHSPMVAELADHAAQQLGLSAGDRQTLRVAALLHDLGSVSVPNGIWDKPGRLNPIEWERVRLHAYQGERVLAISPLLQPVAALVGRHHERLDGSGYHRGLRGELDLAAQILAASDAYSGMLQERAYRSARSSKDAAILLRSEVRKNRLAAASVEAVLAADGHRPVRGASSHHPSLLSPREIEVVQLLARGLSDKEIAQRLSLSPRTVHHHVEHIYAKTGVSGRAAVALYAVRHDLIRAG